jgi:hypothetical protein
MVFLSGATTGFNTSGRLENNNAWLRMSGWKDRPMDPTCVMPNKKRVCSYNQTGPHRGSVCDHSFRVHAAWEAMHARERGLVVSWTSRIGP